VRVECLPDLWDLPAEFATVIYPAAERGERELKIDVVDQAFQILKMHGQLLVLSPKESDAFFPPLVKKSVRKCAALPCPEGSLFAGRKERGPAAAPPRGRPDVAVDEGDVPFRAAARAANRPLAPGPAAEVQHASAGAISATSREAPSPVSKRP